VGLLGTTFVTTEWQNYHHAKTSPSMGYRRLYNDNNKRGDNAYSQYVGYHSRNSNGGSGSAAAANRDYYGYPKDQTVQKNWLAQKYEQTTIRDVWMCWLLAVAWGLWMFSSFVKSDLLRYGQDSITIRGNVRMVTRVEASIGTGIPIYKVRKYEILMNASICMCETHFTSFQISISFSTNPHPLTVRPGCH
jgi:hypothetical protein